MSLLNRLEDAWQILDWITGEISPGCGCNGRSGVDGGNSADPRTEVEKFLDDIKGAVEYIRGKLVPVGTDEDTIRGYFRPLNKGKTQAETQYEFVHV